MQTIKYGSQGEAVKQAQEALIKLGYNLNKYGADGIFGAETKSAVVKFQTDRGIDVDGIIGPITWKELSSYNPEEKPHSEHFKFSEFTCKDGTEVPKQYWYNLQSLMDILEKVRAYWDKPVIIVSGYRTPSYNKSVDGAEKSQHLYANAADIQVQDVSASEVYGVLNRAFVNYGVGKYDNFTHIDNRGYKARW